MSLINNVNAFAVNNQHTNPAPIPKLHSLSLVCVCVSCLFACLHVWLAASIGGCVISCGWFDSCVYGLIFRLGFHQPPYTSVHHLHLHVLAPASGIDNYMAHKFIPRTNRFISVSGVVEAMKRKKNTSLIVCAVYLFLSWKVRWNPLVPSAGRTST